MTMVSFGATFTIPLDRTVTKALADTAKYRGKTASGFVENDQLHVLTNAPNGPEADAFNYNAALEVAEQLVKGEPQTRPIGFVFSEGVSQSQSIKPEDAKETLAALTAAIREHFFPSKEIPIARR